MNAFPFQEVYDHFAKQIINCSPYASTMPAMLFIVKAPTNAPVSAVLVPQAAVDSILRTPDGHEHLQYVIATQVASLNELGADEYAVVLIGECFAKIVPSEDVQDIGDLHLDDSEDTKIMVSIHRPEGVRAGLLGKSADGKVVYSGMQQRNAKLLAVKAEHVTATPVNITIH